MIYPSVLEQGAVRAQDQLPAAAGGSPEAPLVPAPLPTGSPLVPDPGARPQAAVRICGAKANVAFFFFLSFFFLPLSKTMCLEVPFSVGLRFQLAFKGTAVPRML